MMARDATYTIAATVEQLIMQGKFDDAKHELDKFYEKTYKEGYSDAVTNYAVWKDGEPLVGVMQKPLKQVLEEIAKERTLPICY